MNDDRLLAGARTVHVRITLAPEDNASMNTSLPPVLVNAPFYSTTDMLAEISYKYFKSYLPPLMGRPSRDVDDWAAAWFTLKGVVLSGRQVPVGVLSTYMYPAGAAPLELVVHFSKAYPPEACPFRAVSRSQQHLVFNPRHMYFNSLKEALSILTGKGQQVPFMMPDAWRAAWSAARSGSLQQHHDSIHNVKSPIDTKMGKRSGQTHMQIPLRVLICQTPESGQGLCKERFYSRPAVAERLDGSRPTLMDTLYSICPAVFGPAIACRLSVDGPQEHVTLQCNCQLELQSSAELHDVPELPVVMHSDAEGALDSTAVAATVPLPQEATGGMEHVEVATEEVAPESVDPKDSGALALSENDPLGDKRRATEDAQQQVRSDSEGSGVSGLGGAREGAHSGAGAVCELTDGGAVDDAVIGPLDMGEGTGVGSVPEQAVAIGSDVPAALQVPSDSPAVQSEKGRGINTPSPRGQAGLCPTRVGSGCLHEGVEVQVAGVRVQPPGSSGELLQASMLALHELLHAPDLFLYVVVHIPAELYV